MSGLVTLKCPSCGGTLYFSANTHRLTCVHCGAESVVRRDGGSVALEPAGAARAAPQTGAGEAPSAPAVQAKTPAEAVEATLEHELADLYAAREAMLSRCEEPPAASAAERHRPAESGPSWFSGLTDIFVAIIKIELVVIPCGIVLFILAGEDSWQDKAENIVKSLGSLLQCLVVPVLLAVLLRALGQILGEIKDAGAPRPTPLSAAEVREARADIAAIDRQIEGKMAELEQHRRTVGQPGPETPPSLAGTARGLL